MHEALWVSQAYILFKVAQDVPDSHAPVELAPWHIVVQHLSSTQQNSAWPLCEARFIINWCCAMSSVVGPTFRIYSAEKLGWPAIRSSARSSSLRMSYTLMNSCQHKGNSYMLSSCCSLSVEQSMHGEEGHC